MKLGRVVGIVVAFFVFHLIFFVSCSTIQRSLSDDIRNGISVAGKILGVDSPTNIALVSNIAELVARAFTKPENKQPANGLDRQFMSRPSQHLESLDEIPHQIASQQQFDSDEERPSIDDNVIVTTPTTTDVDHGFLGSVLRILGMDTGKIGALAINGIIFIAQMIGRSFVTAVSSMAGQMIGAKPNENIKVSAERPRSLNDDEQQKQSSHIWDNAINWIINQGKTNPLLSQQIELMLDRNLPDRIVQLVDDGNGAAAALSRQRTDCIKQLLCKTAPFIWSMQRAVSAKINTDSDTETNDPDDADANATGTDANSGINDATDDYRLKVFSKYLPTDKEFTKHGVTCEKQYYDCKLF